MTDLEKLAARCEQATADEQPELLIEAFEAIHGPKPPLVHGGSAERVAWLNRFNPFYQMLNSNAFESAAMMLVPEEMRDEIEITTLYCIARVSINLNHGPDGSPFYGSNVSNSIPLALAAAALRARSGGE